MDGQKRIPSSSDSSVRDSSAVLGRRAPQSTQAGCHHIQWQNIVIFLGIESGVIIIGALLEAHSCTIAVKESP